MFRRGLNVGWPKRASTIWFWVTLPFGFLIFFAVQPSRLPFPAPIRHATGLTIVIGWLAVVLGPAAARTYSVETLRGRGKERRCVRCGYDLRYSKDNCPECGRRVPRRLRKADDTATQDPPENAPPQV